MLSTESLTCPWCLAPITVVIDSSPGDQGYIEDCEVCCQPMMIYVRTRGEQLLTVNAERDE